MAKIICKINIFGMKQTVYIQKYDYKGKEHTETYSMPLKDIPNFIASQEEINGVYLMGPKSFTKKIKEDTHKIEIEKYAVKRTNFIDL